MNSPILAQESKLPRSNNGVFEATDAKTLLSAMVAKQTLDYEYGDTECIRCKAPFRYRFLKKTSPIKPLTCVECHDAVQEEAWNEKQASQEPDSDLNRDVPTIYTESDPSRFPASIWSKVEAWDGQDGKGLGIVGETRTHKTRMVYARLIRLRAEKNIHFKALTAFELHRAIQYQWQDDDMKALVKKAYTTPILFLDDFGKQKFTESTEAEFFNLVEDRVKWKRPLVFTSNLDGEMLASMMSDNVALPMIERLREFCNILITRS